MANAPSLPPAAQASTSASEAAWPDPLSFRILVKTEVTSSIPIFAMGVEKGRDAVERAVLTGKRALKQAVGGKAASALRSGRYGAYDVVHCRTRSGRTATYSTWVTFTVAHHAKAFLLDYPELEVEANC